MLTKAIFIGFGARGQIYASYALNNPDKLQIIGVAEKKEHLRDLALLKFGVEKNAIFSEWEELLESDISADAAFICTQDNEHIEPAIACIRSGIKFLMIEKPIDRSLEACEHLMDIAKRYDCSVQICYTLRYMPIFRKLKELIKINTIGKLNHLNLLEGYGHFAFAHAYVRGDWNNSEASSPLLLAKCCHDADMIFFLTEKPWEKVSSFGSLSHFTEENAPMGCATRCINCLHNSSCVYSALKYDNPETSSRFRFSAIEKEGFSSLQEMMQVGRYGKCVYYCDNNVVDHQTVNVLLKDGITANLTVTGFSSAGRQLHIIGTNGEIFCNVDENTLRVHTLTEKAPLHIKLEDTQEHHRGADRILVEDFIATINGAAPVTSIDEAMQSHSLCNAAELSRLTQSVITCTQPSFTLE